MRIYFDHNATTPVEPTVAEAMYSALISTYGNPSSVHHFGQQAKKLLDEARSAVAELLVARPSEVVFTSGGTESDNLAIRGIAELAATTNGRRHLITSAIEHDAVLKTVNTLGKRDGWRCTILRPNNEGLVSAKQLADAIDDETSIVSVMHANNEIGTIQPIRELTAIAHDRGALFHTDAVQAAGKIPIDVKLLNIDLLSISAHKFNGPKGIGALWSKRGIRLNPILTGGGHERHRRAGTENVPALAGFAVAAKLAIKKIETDDSTTRTLRDHLETSIIKTVPGAAINGNLDLRVPNTTNISFEGVEAESLLIALDLEGVSVSTGSACSSGSLEPSHVLRAMGLSASRGQSSIRFSLGLNNNKAEVDQVVKILPTLVSRLRNLRQSSRMPTLDSPALVTFPGKEKD
jgi:cysteine desulfurase